MAATSVAALADSDIQGREPASQASGKPLDRPAWIWTTEERLAMRFDPVEAETRRSAYAATLPPRITQASRRPLRADEMVITIDGRRNPELFLPHELFDGLMTGFSPDPAIRDMQRGYYGPGIVSSGFHEDLFWSQLSSVAAQYLDYKYGNSKSSRDASEGCRLADAALRAAREVFGSDQFDRLLYEVVAPLTWMSTVGSASDADELRRVAGGCR
jgi:hypothetical protein